MLDITSNGRLTPIQTQTVCTVEEWRETAVSWLIDIINVGGHPESRLINVVDDRVEEKE